MKSVTTLYRVMLLALGFTMPLVPASGQDQPNDTSDVLKVLKLKTPIKQSYGSPYIYTGFASFTGTPANKNNYTGVQVFFRHSSTNLQKVDLSGFGCFVGNLNEPLPSGLEHGIKVVCAQSYMTDVGNDIFSLSNPATRFLEIVVTYQ